ncbi:MAG: hypothetical protein RML40_10910 [Bacteroidota bacterium]|nr:hypothetical protein [Candidatus Kapabacteria bacterium]MDW8221024.1 hypothetical protein [Bacteroidota bacterium]
MNTTRGMLIALLLHSVVVCATVVAQNPTHTHTNKAVWLKCFRFKDDSTATSLTVLANLYGIRAIPLPASKTVRVVVPTINITGYANDDHVSEGDSEEIKKVEIVTEVNSSGFWSLMRLLSQDGSFDASVVLTKISTVVAEAAQKLEQFEEKQKEQKRIGSDKIGKNSMPVAGW